MAEDVMIKVLEQNITRRIDSLEDRITKLLKKATVLRPAGSVKKNRTSSRKGQVLTDEQKEKLITKRLKTALKEKPLLEQGN